MQNLIDRRYSNTTNPAADFLLSVMYQTGYLVPRNIEKAWFYCERAATRGSSLAQMTLKNIIEKSDSENRFFQQSLNWFVEAKECTVPEAWYQAAILLTNEPQENQNSEQIMSLYRRAAASGYLPAQNNLALYLADKGRHVEAYETLKTAADAGYLLARFNLILMQLDGTAPVRNILDCIYELRRLAGREFAPAQQKLAELYRDGALIQRDEQSAFRLFSLAGAQGLIFSQFAVVQMLLDEACQYYNPRRAFFTCSRLAMASYHPAQLLLAQLYNFGKGVRSCGDTAMFWYQLAAKNGNSDAQIWLTQAEQCSRN